MHFGTNWCRETGCNGDLDTSPFQAGGDFKPKVGRDRVNIPVDAANTRLVDLEFVIVRVYDAEKLSF